MAITQAAPGITALASAARAEREDVGATKPHTELLVSRHRTAPGIAVRVKGIDCPHPYHQPDELTWHDSHQLADPYAKPAYRRIGPLHRSGDTVNAVFVARRTDHRDRGMLDLLCGGAGGNATAFVTITG